jgi:hypothetical protein
MTRFDFEATGIGSVPFKDAKTACNLILKEFRSIPFWPQLPRRAFLESMYVQYAEGLPALVMDEDKKTIHIESSRVAAEIEDVYEKYLNGEVEYFKISPSHAEGFYEFLDSFKNTSKEARFVKGQITGPVSYGLFLTDENKRSVIYDKDLFEVLSKVLAMKARWQIKKLKKLTQGVIIFLDEPYLVSIGSSYVNVNMDEAAKRLDEVIDSIKKEGALAGIHCCGNTDWPFLLKRDIDILNFDAYNFMKEFSLYPAEINNFLSRGGTIAWGIVPSSEAFVKETDKSLARRLRSALSVLGERGVAKDALSSMLSSSCGLGSLEEGISKKIMKAVNILSEEMRHGGK